MTQSALFVWWILGLVAVAVLVPLVSVLTRDARLRRRRRKSHSRIISKSRQPSVRFSVRPPEE